MYDIYIHTHTYTPTRASIHIHTYACVQNSIYLCVHGRLSLNSMVVLKTAILQGVIVRNVNDNGSMCTWAIIIESLNNEPCTSTTLLISRERVAYIFVHACMRVCVFEFICMFLFLCVSMFVSACVYMCVCVCVLCICVYVYTYVHVRVCAKHSINMSIKINQYLT